MTAVGSLEAEAALLGCLLRLPLTEAKAIAWPLREDDFTEPRHQLVFEAVMACTMADVAPDPVTVLGELRRSGAEPCMTSDRSAGVLLVDLAAAAPVVMSAAHYRRVILEHSFRRRLAEAADRISQVAGSGSLEAVRDVLDSEWLALHGHYGRLTPAPPGVVA